MTTTAAPGGLAVAITMMVVGCNNAPAPPPSPTVSQVPAAAQAPATGTEGPGVSAQRTWSFDDGEAGELAAGFEVASGHWALAQAEGVPSGQGVLAQTAQSDGSVFNVALVQDTSYRDLDLSVKLRARDGRIDQGGGPVWRAKDGNNYYIARYNPLEDNFRLYFVKDGRRRQLASARVQIDHGAWHTIRVRMSGTHVECFLDGVKHLDVEDDTFTAAGRIGLWTKADAQTYFDDLRAGPWSPEPDRREPRP